MAARKLSIALDEVIAVQAKEAAERQGISLSGWLNQAAREALAIEDGLAAADEVIAQLEAEHGPIPPEVDAWAERVLDEAGIPRRRR